MVSTRSASASPVKKCASQPLARSTASTTMPTRVLTPSEPLRLLVAPKNLSNRARCLTLSNPVDTRPRRYFFCPEQGLHELRAIDVPKDDLRSILVTLPNEVVPKAGALSSGHINKSAAYTTATPFDLAFVFLPIVAASTKSNLFQSLEDLLESNDKVYDLLYVIRNAPKLVEDAMRSICDTIDAGDETMYRYSQKKTFDLLQHKAKRVCDLGLPTSMEEKFVTRALEPPILSVRREQSARSASQVESQESANGTPAPSETFDSQSSSTSSAPSVVFSEVSVASSATTLDTTEPLSSIPQNVKSLQRQLVAFRFICASYIPTSLVPSLTAALCASDSSVNFSPLTDYTSNLAKLRAEAAAVVNLSSFSRKRGSLEDEEEIEARIEKKRKLEEEEKRKKANTSRGVKELAKVDVKGMKKMSSFFTKLPAKAKG